MKLLTLVLSMMLAAPPILAADGAKVPKMPIDPSVPACTKVTSREVERFAGGPALLRETNTNTKGLSSCIWSGSRDGVVVKVTYFPRGSFGVPAGQDRAYFDQIMADRKAQNKPGEFVEVSGLGEVAWSLDLLDNPTRHSEVSVFKSGHMLGISTNGLGLAATIELARAAAARM